ncbi:MAG: hypothetical protein AB1710_09495 [Pseudomonadota bacterium]|jgi:hypothetical protein
MNPKINELVGRIKALEEELEAELEARRADLRFRLENRKVLFEREVLEAHRLLKTGLVRYLLGTPVRHLVTVPVIYSMIVPLLVFDFGLTLYQFLCFPAYRVPKVKRGDYFVFDREQLPYLNAIEKLNCAYCTYANGLIAYAREIVARTEQYWCPIKHARRALGTHARYAHFLDYGDGRAYRQELEKLRRDWNGRERR